jgi:ATP-dependent helicase HrpB
LSFNPLVTGLPVCEIIPEIKNHLQTQNTLIVNAAPGAGKSTLVPLCLLEENWLHGKKILMLEPRRLAARSIAYRMSELWGEEVGETIGYRIRFENRIGKNTRIEVVTEGILTRMLQHDNALEDVGLVIFDEFHERSIHADLALALCRESQQVLRPDLKIMIMSATLNMPHLTSLLKAPAVKSEGRVFPVNVFPGEGDIRKCAEILKKETNGIAIHPLYGQLPQNEQYAAIMPNKGGRRKVVLATSIAETSLTIEGVKVVIDSGLGKIQRFDPKSGLSRLETVQISKDSAEQRAGRAGRLSAGVCYRMWTKATHERLAEHRIPEIVEADLASLVLELSRWGISNPNQLTWLSPPPKAHLAQAFETLHLLNALEDGKITEHGKQIHELACHPRLAHMLILAKEMNSIPLACDIAAVLEERDPLPREAGIDINLRIEALRRSRGENTIGKGFKRIEKLSESYRRLLDVKVDNTTFDSFETGLLLSYAYPERIASARPGNNAQFQLSNGKYAAAGHRDDLANEAWLAIAHMDTRDGLGKIFMASPLNPRDLMPMVKEKEIITWDTRKGGLIATKELRIGNIVLQSKPLPAPDEKHLLKAISNALKTEGESLLNFDESMIQLQNRIMCLKKWNPDENWPEVDIQTLLWTNEDWLSPFLNGVKKPEELKKINLSEALLSSLEWEQQEELKKLAPAKIEVPSGSSIKIDYLPNGEQPILSVRLQELFGLAETPKINRNKIGMVIHLLSPGFKPVQVTSDLSSFWNNTYHEVKKDLKRRYPKHSWPDDPWNAAPVAKGRPKTS